MERTHIDRIDRLFKAYDIRGIYPNELNEDFASALGYAIIKYTNAKNVVIGYDCRNSSMKLFNAIIKPILDSGANITHIGLVSRPMLNWTAYNFKYDLGIIITASHNPKEYNGFKFVYKGSQLYYDDGLDKVKGLIEKKDYKSKFKKKKQKGKITSIDYIEKYAKFLSSHLSKDFKKINSRKPLKIVADASNGASGEIIKKLVELNNIDHEIIFAEPDGNFPCHNPNPLDDNALILLSKKVIETKSNFGFIVDPDADRVRFVDEKGNIIENNFVDCLIVKYILHKYKKSGIVHDLISKKILIETIKKNNGVPIISKVGTSNIINNMRKNNAVFGTEMSGHRYYKEMNCFDSGLMTFIQFLNSITHKDHVDKKISLLVKKYNKYIDLGEINYRLKTQEHKNQIIDKIREYFKINKKKFGIKKILSLDGVSAYFGVTWFNIRPSNTEPLLRFRIEGKNKKELIKIKKIMDKLVSKNNI